MISATFFTSTTHGNGGTVSGNADAFFWSGNEYYDAKRCVLWNGTTVAQDDDMPWDSQSGNTGGTAGSWNDHATIGAGYYKGTNWSATHNGTSWANGAVTLGWARSATSGGSEQGSFITQGGYGSVSGSSGLSNCTVAGSGSGSGTTGGNGSGAYGEISDYCITRGTADRSGGESWTAVTGSNLDDLTDSYGSRTGWGDADDFLKATGISNCQTPSYRAETESFNGTSWTTEEDRPTTTSDGVRMGQTDNAISGGGYSSVDSVGYRADCFHYNGTAWTDATGAGALADLPTSVDGDIGDCTSTCACMEAD